MIGKQSSKNTQSQEFFYFIFEVIKWAKKRIFLLKKIMSIA